MTPALREDSEPIVHRSGYLKVLRTSIEIARVELPTPLIAISRWVPSVLLAVWVLTLPLEFTKLYFPNQLIEVSRIVLVLCLLTFVAQLVLERRELVVPASASVFGLALFTAYAAVSALVVGSGQGIKTVLSMVAYFLMMLTVFNWTRTSRMHRRVWSALAVSAVILSLAGLVLHATNTHIWNLPTVEVQRVNATFHDPNVFARFIAFAMLTLVMLVADLDLNRRQRALWVSGALAAAVILPFTYSRAVWAFTLLVALVVIAVARRKRRAIVLVGVVVAIFALVAIIDPSVLSRAALLAENLESPFKNRAFLARAPWLQFMSVLPLDSVRQYLIGSGLIMFVDHPIFGIGFGGFSHALKGPYSGLVPLGVDTTASHTTLITILAETGLVGLTIVLVAGFSFARSAVRARILGPVERTLALAPVIGLLVILLASQFSSRLFEEPYLWLFLGLAYSAQAGLDDVGESREPTELGVTS